MHTGLVHLHRTLAYVALVLLIVSGIKFLMAARAKKEFTEGDRKLSLYTLISVHLQLVIGFVIYFTGLSFSQLKDFGAAMSDSSVRFQILEHPLTMIIGVVLITIGYSSAKRAEGTAKYSKLSRFYLIGLVLILLRVPWDKLF